MYLTKWFRCCIGYDLEKRLLFWGEPNWDIAEYHYFNDRINNFIPVYGDFKLTMVSVSVVIPTYNRADILPRAIDSVLNQTYDDFEIIVVDDGSIDHTEEVLSEINENDIEYICFDKNRGANAARNRGISEAEGDLVSFLDSDDELTEVHLEKVVSTLTKKPPEVGGVYTSNTVIEGGTKVNVKLANKKLRTPQSVVGAYEAGGFSCLTVRRSVFESVGLLDEDFSASQDREFLIRFLKKYELHPIKKELVRYHLHSGQISEGSRKRLDSLDQLVEKHRSLFEKYGLADVNYARGYQYAQIGDMRTANRYFRVAAKENPTNLLYWYQVLSSMGSPKTFKIANKMKRKLKLKLIGRI